MSASRTVVGASSHLKYGRYSTSLAVPNGLLVGTSKTTSDKSRVLKRFVMESRRSWAWRHDCGSHARGPLLRPTTLALLLRRLIGRTLAFVRGA
jgi:hypothetical protein